MDNAGMINGFVLISAAEFINIYYSAYFFIYLCRMSLEELEAYFNGITLPEKVELVQGVVIEDIPLFLESHFSYIRNNSTLKSTEIFLVRLRQLHAKIEEAQQQA
jgi:hypothetical protein